MKTGIGEWLARKLSRVTSTGEYIPEIDGLRFLAILPVMVIHATSCYVSNLPSGAAVPGQGPGIEGVLYPLFIRGWLGVPIFFVLSGFILGLPFARQHIAHGPRVSIGRYLLRRVTRIEPPYLICLTAYWLLLNHRRLPMHYLAGLVYLHQIIYHYANPIHNPTWSLEVEVCFYPLAPLLCAAFLVRPAWLRRTLLFAFTMLYSLRITGYISMHPTLAYTLVSNLQFFTAGLLLADLYLGGWLRRARQPVWDVVAGVAAAALFYGVLQWAYYWLSPLFICLIFAAAFRGRLFADFLRLRPVTIIGGMCYSIYLWHSVPTFWRIGLVEDLPRSISLAATVACYMLLGLLVSVPMFYFVEKPFMGGNGARILQAVLRRLRGVPTPAQAEAAGTGASQ